MTRAGHLAPTAVAFGAIVLANLLIAVGMGSQKGTAAVVALALLPALLLVLGALISTHRDVLVYVGLALILTGLDVGKSLPMGGVQIFLSDIVLLLAIGAAVAGLLMPRTDDGPPRRLRTPVLSLPLALLVAVVTLAAVKGHERYGVALIGQPARLFLYAGIAAAMVGLKPERAWRGITTVFYAGAVVQALWAAYYMATGSSQTQSETLSTGGFRLLALSTSMYLTGSLLCALLNLELHRDRALAQVVDATVGLLALFGIVVSFGRTTYLAVAVIVPLLLVVRAQLRRSIIRLLPLFAPVLVLVVLFVPTASPKLVSTLDARLTKTNSNDINVIWRERARAAVMEGVDKEIVTGVGFGRRSSFTLEGQTVVVDSDPHNSYIYLLAGGGALALGAFLLLVAVYVVDVWRRIRWSTGVPQAVVVWSFGTWLCFMINALAGPVFTDPTLLLTIWITMLLPAIVVRKPEAAGRTTTQPAAAPA